MTLIELLIAMTVMSVGIAALVAGFSSGIVSITVRTSASTAGTLADKQMERLPSGGVHLAAGAAADSDDADPARTVTPTGYRSTAPGPARSARTPRGRPPAAPLSLRAVRSSS